MRGSGRLMKRLNIRVNRMGIGNSYKNVNNRK
jgi:hypothetical protein